MPANILCLFEIKEGKYDLRGKDMFKKPVVRTNVKKNCISVQGVNLWNGLNDELKRSNTIFQFKKMFKSKIYMNYKMEA